MSLLTQILFNEPPPVFHGAVTTHLMDVKQVRAYKQAEPSLNWMNRITAPQRYADAIMLLGGKATAHQIAGVLGRDQAHVLRYLNSKKGKLFKTVGKVQSRGGCRHSLVWSMYDGRP